MGSTETVGPRRLTACARGLANSSHRVFLAVMAYAARLVDWSDQDGRRHHPRALLLGFGLWHSTGSPELGAVVPSGAARSARRGASIAEPSAQTKNKGTG